MLQWFRTARATQVTTLWGRWCLPKFNKHCNQLLKGEFADADNSFCDSLIKRYRKKTKSINQVDNLYNERSTG